MSRTEDTQEWVPFSKNSRDHDSRVSGQQHRPHSPGPECVSIKSQCSMGIPETFNIHVQQKSEFSWSQSSKQHHSTQHDVMMVLKEKIDMFVKQELKRLDRILNSEGQEDFTESTDYTADVDKEDEEHIRCSREALMNIATHFLRIMKQDDLANCLLSRSNAAKCQYNLKSNLKRRFQCVFEGVTNAGNQTGLNQIYTNLYITEGETGGVNFEHEVQQIQKTARKELDKTIKCEDIFEFSPNGGEAVRTMMTEGVAGIGKTVLVQKVVLDWAENKAHHNIGFMFPFSFRELNLLRGTHFSLVGFVHHFFVEMKEAGICNFDDAKVVFILDGLDECRLPLDFQNTQNLIDTAESASLDVLLVNLIRGKLLPSARLWITTRPAASNQIPAFCVSMVTEVRGFANPQKEQYFRKRFRDEQRGTAIISHIKRSRSLHIMCYIPVFCWIAATVLDHVMENGATEQLPQTLTQMYIHFLVVQAKVKSVKYDGRSEMDPHWTPETRKMVASLGKLAFKQLQKGNLIFYESDLSECGLDGAAASVCSGVFTQVFREESGLYQDKVYCFIHLSVQEFLAALHVHLTFFNSGANLLSESPCINHRLKPVNDRAAEKAFYRSSVDKALQSTNGQLDLFLRFLLGLSLQSNQSLLLGLMKHIQPGSHSSGEAAVYIKEKIAKGLPSEKAFNLFHCLTELNDRTLVEEVQHFLGFGNISTNRLSPAQWSALVFILLSDKHDVFELHKYSNTEEALLRLLPVIKGSRESSLSGCSLSNPSCAALATVLSSESCLLNKLDLSYTELMDSGLLILTEGPKSLLCKLQVLRLNGCKLSDGGCPALATALCSPLSKLTELDVSDNNLQDSGVSLLSQCLQSPHCTLTILRLDSCGLSSVSCNDLSSVLECHTSCLRELDLSNNDLHDLGIAQLCIGLMSPHCSLETLRLLGCLLTEKSFISLASALSGSHLTELDLRYNHPGDSGAQIISAAHENPDCSLTNLRIDHAGACRLKPGMIKYVCELSLDPSTAHRNLVLFENNSFMDDEEETPNFDEPTQFEFWHQVLCSEGLTGRCYWEVTWRGLVSIGVTYNGILRRGPVDDSKLGGNGISWALDCSSEYYYAWHNGIIVNVIKNCFPVAKGCRVSVYLNWDAGTVSFYRVMPDRMHLIHTFHSTFTEPLYPAFRIRSENTYGVCNFVGLNLM